MGPRQRLPPHARRARDARLLRPPQPDLHGRPLRRLPRRRARPGRRRRHADHAHDPHRPAVGAAADPEPRPREERVRRGRRVPAHRRAAEPAGRRPGPHPRAQRGGQRPPARRPPVRRRAWSGCPTTCGSPTSRWAPRPATLDYDLAISADPTTPPTITDTGVEVAEAQPVLPDGRGAPALADGRRRARRPDRRGGLPRPRGPPRRGRSRHEPPPLGDVPGPVARRRRRHHRHRLRGGGVRHRAGGARPRAGHRRGRHRPQPLRHRRPARHARAPRWSSSCATTTRSTTSSSSARPRCTAPTPPARSAATRRCPAR